MARYRSPLFVIGSLAAIAVLFMILFMTYHVTEYSFPFRLRKLGILFLIGYAIAVSTVLFQTVTNNRILTPSIMGFDQLYILIQTTLLFFWDRVDIPGLNVETKFLLDSLILVAFASLLFRFLFGGTVRGLHLTLLIGVVCGGLFFSLRMLMQLTLDPDAAIRLTDIMFANFNKDNSNLLGISFVVVVLISFIGWRMRHYFDVLTLGRESAISLGVDYQRVVMVLLVLISVLVAVSTALVGPVTFFGLLVASLAYQLSPTARHIIVLPIAALLGIIFLVGGQFLLEHIFNMTVRLPFIIEFIGGIVFLSLLTKGKIR